MSAILCVFGSLPGIVWTVNDNLDAVASTIYQETFVNTEHDSWIQGTLEDLLTVRYGKDHKNLSNGIVPLFGSGGIMRYVERALYEKVSVLIPRKGSLNNIIYIDEPFWSVDTMFYTEIKNEFAAKFVYYFVRSKDLARMNTGSAVPSMTAEVIHSMTLAIPDDDTLKQFDMRLEPMFSKMKCNNQECERLIQLQHTLISTISSR